MKVYKKDVLSGPLRWLMRFGGWILLPQGIFILILGDKVDFLNSYMYENKLVPLLTGVLLVVLDVFLPDPARERRKLKKKLKKLYDVVCKALPSNKELFAATLNGVNRVQLEQQIRINPSFSKDFFRKVPILEVLIFIHTLNPQAAYAICADIAQTVKNSSSK